MADEKEGLIEGIKQVASETKTKAAEAVADAAKATLIAKEAKDAADNAVKQAQSIVDGLKAEVKTMSEANVTRDERDKENQKGFNDFLARQKDIHMNTSNRMKSFEGEIEELLEKSKDNLAKKNRFSIDLNRKAVGDMSSAGNLTGSYFVAPDTRPGIVLRPYEEIHMRNLMPVGRTNSNVIRHVRDNGGEGGPAMVAEGGTKQKMDRDLSVEDANVRKIATYLRIPEEMIEDIPYITGFLTSMGTEETLKLEDSQILYGDGTGQNLSGLFTNATAFGPGAAAKVAAPNRFDVLRAARMQMRKLKRKPNYALLSPLDYYLMTSAKDSTGNYILQGGGNGLVPNLDGVPLIEHTEVVENDFLLGDRMAAELDFRSNLSIRFFEQDQNNAITNMVTVVIEERLAMPIYYVNGLIKGTFTAGITALTAA